MICLLPKSCLQQKSQKPVVWRTGPNILSYLNTINTLLYTKTKEKETGLGSRQKNNCKRNIKSMRNRLKIEKLFIINNSYFYGLKFKRKNKCKTF